MKYLKTFEEITVYHGSGKLFKKFDTTMMSKKMSQDTYGWGFYFTDNEEVSKIYANEHDDKYVYQIKLHKGKGLNDYDYLIFDKKPTEEQINKVLKQAEIEKIEIELSDVKIGWDLMKSLFEYFYDTLSMDDQFSYGYNTAKKMTSLFLIRAGVDGMKYKMPNDSELNFEHGYDGYNYVVFDENNITIDKIDKL